MKKIFIGILMALLVTALASGGLSESQDGQIRGYDPESGYVYVTYGRWIQTIDGGDPENPKDAWKWRRSYSVNKVEGENREKGVNIGSLEREPILWRVLSVDGDSALLCSEYILYASALDSSKNRYILNDSYCKDSELYEELNMYFGVYAFTKEELGAIYAGKTERKITLLSNEQLKDKSLGFGTDKSRKAWATEYAIRMTGAYIYSDSGECNTTYWTSTSCEEPKGAGMRVMKDGKIGYYSCQRNDIGVRPVITLNIAGIRITGGGGTKTDPYVAEPCD